MCVSQPGRVRATHGPIAVVTVDGRDRDVPLVALGDEATAVVPGDWLLLQTGLAVRRLAAAEAAELVATLGGVPDVRAGETGKTAGGAS
jgi:hydrogenase assembly chaperone HypC/HupF